jgi:hypothetical protein
VWSVVVVFCCRGMRSISATVFGVITTRQPRLVSSSTAQSSDSEEVSPGNRPITFVRRRTSTNVRSRTGPRSDGPTPTLWGDYTGRLTAISYLAYETTAVAYKTAVLPRYCDDSTRASQVGMRSADQRLAEHRAAHEEIAG